jgi:hypothetical protein
MGAAPLPVVKTDAKLAALLSVVREGLREYFLLERAEREVSARSADQQAKIRNFVAAGDARLAAAAALSGGEHVPAALVLYRDGIVFVVRALLEARGRESSEQTAEDAFRSLAPLVESGDLPPKPDGFDDARALLTDTRPLAYDELPAAEALSKRAQVEATALWLRGLVDARGPRQVKLSRALRIGAIGLLALLGVGFGVWKLVAPKNIALGKPVQLSSRRPECPAGTGAEGLSPAGLVDGTVSSTYDICTKGEVRPWAILDLQKVRPIGKVVVHNRADCCWGNWDLPVALELSDDGTNFREIARRTTAYTAAVPWVAELGGQSGRFVRLRADSNEPRELVLTELEVYAP